MISLSCRKARAMVEELLDDTLDEAGRDWLDSHLAQCHGCRGFSAGAIKVREVLADQRPVFPSPKALRRMRDKLEEVIVSGADATGDFQVDTETQRWPAWAFVASAAAVAVFFVGVHLALTLELPSSETPHVAEAQVPSAGPEVSAPEASAPSTPAVAEPPAVQYTLASVRGHAAGSAKGPSLSAGAIIDNRSGLTTGERSAAVVDMVEARLALGSQTEVMFASHPEAHHSLHLRSGWIACDVTKATGGSSAMMIVETAAGSVRVVGTVFAIDATQQDAMAVRVREGTVVVTPASGVAVTIEAGQEGLFPQGRVGEIDEALARLDSSLLQGQVVARRVPAQLDVATLFRMAEAARREGDTARATRLYRRITVMDPSGPSGGTALITLGQLSLRSNAAEANRSFRRYLARFPSGPMRQEAFAGLLRAAGPTSRPEIAARYLREFPQGRYRSQAQRYLAGTTQ